MTEKRDEANLPGSLSDPTRPIPGHYYQLSATRYPDRVYRCDSVSNGLIDLAIVKPDESEIPERIAITDYRFATMAEETEKP
jgi:hypothetical protein